MAMHSLVTNSAESNTRHLISIPGTPGLLTLEETRAALASQAPSSLMAGPLHLDFEFCFEPPQRCTDIERVAMLAGKVFDSGKPDFDELFTLYCDAMTGVVWATDASIASSMAWKKYKEEPCTVIRAWLLKEDAIEQAWL